MIRGPLLRKWISPALWSLFLIVIIFDRGLWLFFLGALFAGRTDLLYPRADLLTLTLEHLGMVAASGALAGLTGIGLGIAVSRRSGAWLRPLADRLAALGQTFPPAAVLALTLPFLGFGFGPTILGLWFYGTLPVLRGTLTGLAQVSPAALDAGRGLGFGPLALFVQVEGPLAFPYLWAGLRTSTVINVGTAALGATIGAGGLGAPIVSGLVTQNYAFLLEGAITSGILALTIDAWFGALGGRRPDENPQKPSA
jgi:osmoprotectant transport system permease protein